MTRAWSLGAGPGDEPMTIDLDSTICEVYGCHKHGAGYGYTHVLGYHPLLATRADTGETLHVRFRKGSGQHPARRPAIRARGGGSGATRRGERAAHPALRLGASSPSSWSRRVGTTRCATRSPSPKNPAVKRGHRSDHRGCLAPIDYTLNGEAWVGGDNVWRPAPTRRAPHQAQRSPARAVPHLSLPRLHYRP